MLFDIHDTIAYGGRVLGTHDGNTLIRSHRLEPETASESSDIIRASEACDFLRIHRNTLYRLARTGQLPAFKMSAGGTWRFRKSELEDWVENRRRRYEI